jgi:hypothetical protein
MSRLFEFAFTDHKYRFKAYSTSGAIALISALAAHFSLRWDERDVILTMASVFCSLVAIFVLYYIFAGKSSAPGLKTPAKPYLFRYTMSIFVIVVAGLFSISTHNKIVPQVQAAIVDLRLFSLTSAIPHALYIRPSDQTQGLFRGRFQKLQSIADISYRYRIPVDPNRLVEAQKMIQSTLAVSGLSEETRQSGLIASAKLVDLATLRKTETNTEEPLAYSLNSTVMLPNRTIRYQGNHSRLSGSGQLEIAHSTVVFDGFDFEREKPFGEPFFILSSDSTVVVRNSTIKNTDQPLDGIIWINVQFQHSMIRVNGGPFTLVNVTFNDCDLRWLTFGPLGSDLQERIRKANGQPISFAFDGNVNPTSKP